MNTNGMPLVSILMTSYNREKYIADAIRSALASTYRNFELIIVDDCSTDRTVEIARSFASTDERVKLFVNEKNLGQFANRNLAASYATGEYLKYLDSDDLIYSHGLEVIVRMMEEYPEAGFGLFGYEQDAHRIFPFMLSPRQSFERHFINQIRFLIRSPLSSIIRKPAFFGVGGFTNPGDEGDYELMLALAAKYNVLLMPDGITWYRIHEEQVDSDRRKDPLIHFRYYTRSLHYLNAADCPLDAGQRKEAIEKLHREMVHFILLAFKRSGKAAGTMLKQSDFGYPYFMRQSVSIISNKIFRGSAY